MCQANLCVLFYTAFFIMPPLGGNIFYSVELVIKIYVLAQWYTQPEPSVARNVLICNVPLRCVLFLSLVPCILAFIEIKRLYHDSATKEGTMTMESATKVRRQTRTAKNSIHVQTADMGGGNFGHWANHLKKGPRPRLSNPLNLRQTDRFIVDLVTVEIKRSRDKFYFVGEVESHRVSGWSFRIKQRSIHCKSIFRLIISPRLTEAAYSDKSAGWRPSVSLHFVNCVSATPFQSIAEHITSGSRNSSLPYTAYSARSNIDRFFVLAYAITERAK